ncbi:DNA helicase/exodeoxyribonuclease V subunit A [Salinicoccus kekensis]|uniref:DNA 3'-5' helicase n=2 Tax=Salinicoccus kekensis TaxID=714307 RepID=A0A285UT45_9STAP|nr:DNA helicase/exodeoxyribonuclease V subunit A [Salinicoccus kekensis]
MVTWTDEQYEAIHYTGSDILISAAAGSGKTTVLVERIIQNIVGGRYSVDELLVSTFTNMSARDMKEKIEKELRKKHAETGDPRLNEEILKLNGAHISTLHSFCLYLIRMHYNVIGISPDMRTLSDIEGQIRLDGVIDRVLEDYYAEGTDVFTDLTFMTSSDKNNSGLVEIIKSLYFTAVASPDPLRFLESRIDQYEDVSHLEAIVDAYNEIIRHKLIALETSLQELHKAYHAIYHEDIKETQKRDAFDALADLMRAVERAVEANLRGEAVNLPPFSLKDGRTAFFKKIADPYEKKHLTDTQNKVKQSYSELLSLPAYTVGDAVDELSPMNEMNNTLIRIAIDVLQGFRHQKNLRNEMDFSDYEHYALAILNANDHEVAEIYREQFKEIMIDEYQDINRVQEAIISLIKSGDEKDGNLFMVGDVKQSIYKFRQADPSLFIEKANRFRKPGSGKIINLNHNFRSRGEVLDLTNSLFERIMDETVGEIEYDDTQKLVQGNYLDAPEIRQELHVIEEADEIEGNAEIRHIIDVIKEKVSRGADYRDIVILTRNTTDNEDYRKMLSEAGLPVYVNNRTGYLDTLEVRSLLSILSIIDNPLQDDHFTGTMRLPQFDFSEEDIAKIRAGSEAVYMYEAAREYEAEDDLKKRLDGFFTVLDELRTQERYLSVPELIDEIYYQFNLLEYFSGLPGGQNRRANLNGLVEKAMEFEEMSHISLYQFITTITRMIADGQDFGEENTVSPDDDILRVMTIHASKGLEFDHVIYAGIHRNLNFRDLHARVIVHADYGIGFKRFNSRDNTILPSIHSIVMQEYIKKETISEEMRLIYVAMTRAVEQLTIPVVFKKEQKEKYLYNGGMVLADYRLNINSVQELIFPVLKYLIDAEYDFLELIDVEIEDAAEEEKMYHLSPETLLNVDAGRGDGLYDKFSHRYHSPGLTDLVHKESVTEIKRKNSTHPDDAKIVRHTRKVNLREPEFLNRGVEAPIFGTVMHEVMMHLMNDWPKLSALGAGESEAYIDRLISTIRERETFLTDVHVYRIKDNISRFFNDPVMMELLENQKQIHTEIPFIMNQQAIGYSEHEDQIVQGIMDCLLEIDGHYTIIDYKTDWVPPGADKRELAERYKTQMDIYRRSAEKALGREVEVYLYFFLYGAIKVED